MQELKIQCVLYCNMTINKLKNKKKLSDENTDCE